MKYIYIENYLKIAQSQKESFLNFLNKSKEFQVSNQKIVFCEESLLIGFLDTSTSNNTYNKFKDFFKDFSEVNVNIITKIISKSNYTIIQFLNNKQLRIL